MTAYLIIYDDENIYLVWAKNQAEAEETATRKYGTGWKHIEQATAEYLEATTP